MTSNHRLCDISLGVSKISKSVVKTVCMLAIKPFPFIGYYFIKLGYTKIKLLVSKMGISNDINATNRVSNANGYSNHHNMVNGNGVAEKAIRSCHDPAHGGSVINFNPGPAKIAPSVSRYFCQ